MLPDELSPVTRKWTLSCSSWMTSSEGLMQCLAFCCHIHFSPQGSFIYSANSMPYGGAASSILCTSPYPVSSDGGNVIAGAGTLNSLNHLSSPAGVSRMSIRLCSDGKGRRLAGLCGSRCVLPSPWPCAGGLIQRGYQKTKRIPDSPLYT